MQITTLPVCIAFAVQRTEVQHLAHNYAWLRVIVHLRDIA